MIQIQTTKGKIREYRREDAPIDFRGRRLINKIISENLGEEYILPSNIRTEDFDWRLVNKQGKIAKRITKYLRQKGAEDFSHLIQDIGQIAHDHASQDETFYYDIVDSFDWSSGDFGDSGSCFWSSNRNARYMLESVNSYAIRFYNSPNFHDGFGRAWIVPTPSESGYVVFNSYSMKLVKTARILADMFGTDYKQVRLKNLDEQGGVIWINNGVGYYLFPHSEDAEHIDSIDMQIKNVSACYNCSNVLMDEDYMNHNGRNYCYDCYSENFSACDRCEEVVHNNDLQEIENESYCNSCISALATRCESCSDYKLDESITHVENRRGRTHAICESCLERDDVITNCTKCETYHLTRDMQYLHLESEEESTENEAA